MLNVGALSCHVLCYQQHSTNGGWRKLIHITNLHSFLCSRMPEFLSAYFPVRMEPEVFTRAE